MGGRHDESERTMKPHKHVELSHEDLVKLMEVSQVLLEKFNLITEKSISELKELLAKPEPKPDVVRYLMTNEYECVNLKLYEDRLFVRPQYDYFNNLYEQIKIVRDSFGKLKHVEVYK